MANMQGFGMMIDKLKKNPKTIVFTEGTDARIQEAASRCTMCPRIRFSVPPHGTHSEWIRKAPTTAHARTMVPSINNQAL